MRIFFSVGEPSGDLHGANLIKDLRQQHPAIEAVGFGGPKMENADCRLLFDLTSLAVMGLWNVLINIRQFFALLAQADRYFAENKVDAVVLIDFPGFNWHIARKARKHGIEVFYYGVPQMWAWLPWRVHKLRRLVDHVLCKLPFEVSWFEQRGCQATCVGHPYFDELVRYAYNEEFLRVEEEHSPAKLLVLLPGSRTQEVKRNLPGLLKSAWHVKEKHPQTRIAIACFRESHAQYAKQECQADQVAEIFVGRTPELISLADACIACSGSVSLELLYHRKPTVIVYRVSKLVMFLQRFLLRCQFITLVNLLSLKRIERAENSTYDPRDLEANVPMPEFLTAEDCSDSVACWINGWFADPFLYAQKIKQLDRLASSFAHPGASKQAARYILENATAARLTEGQARHSSAA